MTTEYVGSYPAMPGTWLAFGLIAVSVMGIIALVMSAGDDDQ